ncbi:hypothetical protein CRG98_029999 [Punica granatum]|uniref:Uncharacterized protein n=1 Tax=Punica granatum TaxID=22663 RepID=A0A2I0J035_PUNGR|nr:hypothetical protein CRG98_029999 [Punica granatum]
MGSSQLRTKTYQAKEYPASSFPCMCKPERTAVEADDGAEEGEEAPYTAGSGSFSYSRYEKEDMVETVASGMVLMKRKVKLITPEFSTGNSSFYRIMHASRRMNNRAPDNVLGTQEIITGDGRSAEDEDFEPGVHFRTRIPIVRAFTSHELLHSGLEWCGFPHITCERPRSYMGLGSFAT